MIFRGCLRGYLSSIPRWAGLDGLVFIPNSERQRHLAELPFSFVVGRICRFDLWYGLGTFLVRRLNPGFGVRTRPRKDQDPPISLWFLRYGLERIQSPLAKLRDVLLDSCWPIHAARTLCSHDRILRLRHLLTPWVAYDHFPALLCCRSDIFRIRNGAYLDASSASDLPSRGSYHAIPYRLHDQDRLGHWIDGWLCLRDGVLHCRLWSQRLLDIRFC